MNAVLLGIEPFLQIVHGSGQALKEEPGEPEAQSCKEEANPQRDEDDRQKQSPQDKQAFVFLLARLQKLLL